MSVMSVPKYPDYSLIQPIPQALPKDRKNELFRVSSSFIQVDKTLRHSCNATSLENSRSAKADVNFGEAALFRRTPQEGPIHLTYLAQVDIWQRVSQLLVQGVQHLKPCSNAPSLLACPNIPIPIPISISIPSPIPLSGRACYPFPRPSHRWRLSFRLLRACVIAIPAFPIAVRLIQCLEVRSIEWRSCATGVSCRGERSSRL